MSPEPPPPRIEAPPPPPPEPPPEVFPFWGYPDVAVFLTIALAGLMCTSLAAGLILKAAHVKEIFVELPAQFLLYGLLLGTLAVIFRRYYGRPFWKSMRWVPSGVSVSLLVSCGISLAFAIMIASVLLRTPDTESPMKELLSDRASMLLVGVAGTTLGPVCEELLFRGFLQPVLVESFGAALGIFLTAVPFGLLHVPEYGGSWRHGLLITMTGVAFGWMRQRTGSTKAAAIMHATYNGVFFLLLALQQTVH